MQPRRIVSDIRHPNYTSNMQDWRKWRDVYEGGQDFINRYLQKFSIREGNDAFERRKRITYNPAFAQEAVDEVKNSIFQRLEDISRKGGSDSYNNSILGKDGGIDLLGSSMNCFIGQRILSELLVMKKVGIYVDMPPEVGVTLAESVGKRPYVYIYCAENICSWAYDDDANPNEFTSVLLRDTYYDYDKDTGLPVGMSTRYRRIWVADNRVHVQYYNEQGDEIDYYNIKSKESVIVLDIPRIPFVVPEITHSLLKDVCNYQIALLNLASADMAYALNSNFPFYVEQYDPRYEEEFNRPSDPDDTGTESEAVAKTRKAKLGTQTGRRYPKGLERPGFIHPSAEPLTASMAKQDQLKKEIRQLVNLSVSTLTPKVASAESKSLDQQGLEAGLSYIGLELENMERKIAEYWNMYEKKGDATIFYPTDYSLKSMGEKIEEANFLKNVLPTVPSTTYRKAIATRIAELTVGRDVSAEDLNKIETEIKSSKGMTADPEIIAKHVEIGILDLELAADISGYPKGTVDKAAQNHADRLKRIQETQTPNNDMLNGAPRGIPQQDPNSNPSASSKQEKASAKDTTKDPVVTDKTRGPNG